MFKGTFANVTATAGTNIPFEVKLNTNTQTVPNAAEGTVALHAQGTGYYDIDVVLELTGAAATPITAQLYANGQPITEAIASQDITVTTGIATLNLHDAVRVVGSLIPELAEISVRLVSNAIVTAGVFTITQIR